MGEKLENWKKLFKNPKEEMKRIMLSVTPAQQLHAQLVGQIGMMIGLVLAWVVMFKNGMWYFSLVMFFALFLNMIQYVKTRQEYHSVCKMMDEIRGEQLEEANKGFSELNGNEESIKELNR